MASFDKRTGKVIPREKSDQLPLVEANKRQAAADKAGRDEQNKAARIAHAAIDSAFRPKAGPRRNVQKALRARPG